MAESTGLFLFEVMLENVTNFSDCQQLIIRTDFANIFSLELKDPKKIHFVMPEPAPLPPGKKPAKQKKGQEPGEPVIQVGQSVLFACSADLLMQIMKKYTVELSLWNKEENMVFVGSTPVLWENTFFKFLDEIMDCQMPNSVSYNDEYNIFEEGIAKIIAKVKLEIKLTYLKDKLTTSFRSLSEDPAIKKYLYTGINSKTTSFMCTMNTTDEVYEESSNKIEKTFIQDKPVAYADYKNAPGANLGLYTEGDYCCMGNADKPPSSIYKAPQALPSTDYIIDYVRKIIISCNDNLRMLTPQSTIKPEIKATDLDKVCICAEKDWPPGPLAQVMKEEITDEPCVLCIDNSAKREAARRAVLKIEHIRGPCGRADCRVARDIRSYLEKLIIEDNKEIEIEDIIGPCGSKSCTVAVNIRELLRRSGLYVRGKKLPGYSTQCACLDQMEDAMIDRTEPCTFPCNDICKEHIEMTGGCLSSHDKCDKKKCCANTSKVKQIYYCAVQYNFEYEMKSETSTPDQSVKSIRSGDCVALCPSLKSMPRTCARSSCSLNLSRFHEETVKGIKLTESHDSGCKSCQKSIQPEHEPSPADSHVMLDLKDIPGPCSAQTCDIAKNFQAMILDSVKSKKELDASGKKDPCFCDCDCKFGTIKRTTYCPICGGYEVLGDDLNGEPSYVQPIPCPMYHKIYDKSKVQPPYSWPNESKMKDKIQDNSNTSGRGGKPAQLDQKQAMGFPSTKKSEVKKDDKKNSEGKKDVKSAKQKGVEDPSGAYLNPHLRCGPQRPPRVPKHMGWLWTAEDIPGMGPRPMWRPGAASKFIVRKFKAVRGQIDVLAKKKKLQKKKKIEMKPTLLVTKAGGEYTVQMEVFKQYTTQRYLCDYPYEERPPLLYTIGKTDEEKLQISKIRERRERKDRKRKSKFVQSTFRDRCQEICVKAYNQALGLVPIEDNPECPCETYERDNPSIESCTCSEDDAAIVSSDTDGDEWVISFTPPAARWDPNVEPPPQFEEKDTQYTYLDYKVKLLDKSGNPVPRFFKGPDGKTECSDLGGFWGPGHVWTEINKDGYIGVDNRWVPNNFTGPDGNVYPSDEGNFKDTSGQLLHIGIDGYVDKDGKWAWYSKKKRLQPLLSSVPKGHLEVKNNQVKEHKNHNDGGKSIKQSGVKMKNSINKINTEFASADKRKGTYGNKCCVMNLSTIHDRYQPHWVTKKVRPKYAAHDTACFQVATYDSSGAMRHLEKINRACNTSRSRMYPFTFIKKPKSGCRKC
ncbi:hypothetical protein EVAR_99021_1 [Eumeta japonica]|uniref:DUF4776 domain-containing protein n=1 Tax=Eumeta variegata TaxID=151549 RepID=A0A4C1XXQ0_EUMVA|nr:hypothetical protein EVAR_99021_1 [Eumeta japonica]